MATMISEEAAVLFLKGPFGGQIRGVDLTAAGQLVSGGFAVRLEDITGDYPMGGQTAEVYSGVTFTTLDGYPYSATLAASVAGGGTDTLTISFAGSAMADGSVTITGLAVDGTAIDLTGLSPVSITDGDTASEVATAVATALDGAQDVGDAITIDAAATGPVVTLTQTGSGGAGNFGAGASVVVA